MYEQVSHALLNDILDELRPDVHREDLRHFYTRLGANFYAIHTLFAHLYGHRDDFFEQITALVDRLARAYIDRPAELERIDMAREEDHNWFLSQEYVGLALYCDGFVTLEFDRNQKRRLLDQGIKSLPNKLDRATWLNYARCHDDIGLGFDDTDIRAIGSDPKAHRRFLVEWFTGRFEGSPARGRPFGINEKTGDARISGSLASLVGLESAIESGEPPAIDLAINRILLLHGVIMSFGGIPLLYYGDEIGTLNDYSFLEEEYKAGDSRWMHRPRIDWEKAERRREHGSVEQRIFDGLKRMISARKTIPAFADFNNRELLDVENPHLFAFLRTHPQLSADVVLVVANFDLRPNYIDLSNLKHPGLLHFGQPYDIYSGETPGVFKNRLVVPPCRFYWLTN